MDIQQIRSYCLSKTGSGECMPFDDTTLVFKVGGKIFALLSLDVDKSLNLKCDPEYAQELRERFPSITPGYHMNKKHWNTIALDGLVGDEMLRELIDHSFGLVFKSLPSRIREDLEKKTNITN